MRSPESQHVVVVGRGIAGAYAAWVFRQRGCRVSWWGDDSPSASRVAAGMFNPVSFRHVLEVWNAQEHLGSMRTILQDMERTLGLEGAVVHDVPVLKVFPNTTYAALWQERREEGHGVCQWTERGSPAPSPHVHAPHGVGKVVASGWVDLPRLLDALQALWSREGNGVNRRWERGDGLPEGADLLVDCRGVGATSDLAEGGLKVQPNHGDVLTLESPMLEGGLDTAGCNINHNAWLLPLGKVGGRMRWRLGATYGWNRLSWEPLPESEEFLFNRMAGAFHGPGLEEFRRARVVAHEAGLRPASPDRRPMVGPWPGQPEGLAMINGLGTRGVLVGASAALHVAHWWLDGADLPPEVDPRRFRGFKK